MSAQMNDQFDALFDCFVISLKRTPHRLQDFRARNEQCGINLRHFEAIDGAQLNETDIGRIVAKGAIGYSPGRVGVAMSHLTLSQHCAEQAKAFVVFEDDAVARQDIKAQLITATHQFSDWDIILLGYNTDAPLELSIAPDMLYGGTFSTKHPTAKQLSDFASSNNKVGLHRLHLALGLCGYVIMPKGAQNFSRMCFPMDNRLVHSVSLNYSFRSYGLDCIMASIFQNLSAFACVAPLAMTPNNFETSLTQKQ